MYRSRSRAYFPRSTYGSPFDLVSRFIGNAAASHSATAYPAFNVWSNEDGAVITSELPGVKMDELDLTVHGKTVTIKGARKEQQDQQQGQFVRRERPDGEFSRMIELPYQIDNAKVEAKLQNGVLEIKLPRAEADKPRKIAVGA